MATKKTETEAKNQETNSDLARFTYSIKTSGEEMLVIREDDPEQLLKLRSFFLEIIPRTGKLHPSKTQEIAPGEPEIKKPTLEPSNNEKDPVKSPSVSYKNYMHPGEICKECQEGIMKLKAGINKQTGEEYKFLSCSRYPECKFSAYISKYPQKHSA